MPVIMCRTMSAPRHDRSLTIPAPPDDLALAFANTRYWRGLEKPTEELHSLADLVAWCGSHGGIGQEGLNSAGELGEQPDRWFAKAIETREAVAGIFRATAEGRTPRTDDLAAFDAALAATPPRSRLARLASGYGWQLERAEAGIPLLLAPVLWSAADLLAGKRLQRVRRCANDGCLWLFLDDSKSGNRKWCMMSACGNRAKAHRHRARVRDEHRP
jgi:predicted RNA-binding Zn ribbon-like protein